MAGEPDPQLLQRLPSAALTIFLLVAITSGEREVELISAVPLHPDTEPVTLTALPHAVGGKVWLQFDWYFFDQEAGSPDATAWYNCTENDCQDTQTNFYPLGNFSYRVNVSKWNVVGPVEPWAVGHANVFVAAKLTNLIPGIAPLRAATVGTPVVISTIAEPLEDLTGVIHYNYSFGDGAPWHASGSNTSVVHVYTAAGTYNVSVVGTSAVNSLRRYTMVVAQTAVDGGVVVVPAIVGTRGSSVTMALANLTGTDVHYRWDFDNGVTQETNTSSVSYVYNITGLFNITVTAYNLVSTSTFKLTASIKPNLGPKHAAEIATPLAVALVSVVLIVGGVSYHRWYFGRRGVEVADFDFVNTPQKPKSLLGRLSRSNKRGSSGYGAVDLYEL